MDITFDAPMSITQYDTHDDPISVYTDTFINVFSKIKDFDKFYYRVTALGKHDTQYRVSTNYFGVRTTSIGGFNLSEESFINSYLNHEIRQFAKAKAEGHRIKKGDFSFTYILAHDIWYYNRMKTLSQNTKQGFSVALEHFLQENKDYKQIFDLNMCSNKSGLYILILDKYNVCYIGQADDIRKRIMRHWSRNDYFTGTGIDMFKAYDTSNIYAAFNDEQQTINVKEHDAISTMPPRYTLNCLSGGKVDYILENRYSITVDREDSIDFTDYVLEDYDFEERVKGIYHRFCC